MTEEIKIKGTIFYLYLGQLAELGLLEGPSQLTTKGFDMAIDAHDMGIRLTEQEILGFITAHIGMADGGILEENVDMIYSMIDELQKLGFEKMKKQIKDLTDGKEEINSI